MPTPPDHTPQPTTRPHHDPTPPHNTPTPTRTTPTNPHTDPLAAYDAIHDRSQQLRRQLARVVVGQDPTIDMLLVALLAQGHVLIVGVPGLAKTLLARALAAAVGLKFQRIQFTPDMMPADIIGTEIIQTDPTTGHREPAFRPGPIFAQLILADEVNRTPPKTQAALLEAMAERQVTAAGRTIPLEPPCIVIATQNPIEQEGTYPLPEAQLDRFMLSLWLDYPDPRHEAQIAARLPHDTSHQIDQVFTLDDLVAATHAVAQVPVSPHVAEYAVRLVRATRPSDPLATPLVREHVQWGAGPRSGQHLLHAARALAAIEAHPTPSCDHVRRLALPTLRHRIVLGFSADPDAAERHILQQVIDNTPEPTYDDN